MSTKTISEATRKVLEELKTEVRAEIARISTTPAYSDAEYERQYGRTDALENVLDQINAKIGM